MTTSSHRKAGIGEVLRKMFTLAIGWGMRTDILPLVPYLDTLRWVFIAVVLIGIAVAIHARIDDWKRGQR